MNAETLSLVRQAVKELAEHYPENMRMNPWWNIHWTINNETDEYVAWWWRSINKIDIPTWRTLRAKVVELRLRA